MSFRSHPARVRSLWFMTVSTTILATLLPQASASAHTLSLADKIDHGEQVASATEGSQNAESPICLQVRQVDGIVQQLRAAITTDDSERQELEGRASEGSTLCSSSVRPGPFSVELTATAGRPGSALHVDVLHGHSVTDAFSPAAAMEVERTGHGAALLPDGRVLVVGGEHPGPSWGLSAPSTSEIYDPISDTWEPAGALKTYRYQPELVTLPDGRVAVFGGIEAPLDRQRLVEVFDPTSGRWSELGSINGNERGTATLLSSGQVLLIGTGEVAFDQASTYEIFDPATGTSKTSMAQTPYRFGHTATTLPNGTVLLAGGNGNLLEASVFDPATGRFRLTGPANDYRIGHEAILLDDGRVLVTGGRNPYGNEIASTEIYDPSTDSWTAIPTRVGGDTHSSTQLRDGRVLVIASSYGSTWALALDPTTGTVSLLDSQPAIHRRGHTATTLRDGRVLIAGGGDRYYSTSTTELFTPAQH